MALTETRPETVVSAEPAPRTEPTPVEKVLGSGDHKTVGRIFIGASLLFAVIDLAIAGLANLQTASGDSLLEVTAANRLALNHPISLMLCAALPLILGLAIYIVPLQVGSPTIAFPRAAAMSLWGWLGGTVLFSVALIVKGSYGGSSREMTRLGHVSVGLLTVSLLVGIVCVMVTVLSNRVAGMTIGRVPFFSFSMLVTGALWLATLPPVVAIITVWQIRRPSPSDLEAGAYPALEWLFHQPALYILAIPVLGIMLDISSAVSGQRQAAYGVMQGAIVAFGAFTFGSWAQGEVGRNTVLWVVSSAVIALPVLIVLGGSLDTLRRGAKSVSPGVVLAFISMLVLLLATLVGAFLGLNTAGKGSLTSALAGGFGGSGPGLAVAQFYLAVAASLIAATAALFHWGSRIWAGGLPKAAGLAIAPLALIGGIAFGAGHGILGATTPNASTSQNLAGVSGVGSLVLAVALLGAFMAVLAAVKAHLSGNSAESEDDGGTLEWLAASPPVAGNFEEPVSGVESAYPLFDRADSAGASDEKGSN